MVTIRAAVEGDLQAVAQVHMRCFPDYFLTKLGERLLEAYYREFFEEDGPFAVAQEEGPGGLLHGI